MAESALAKKMKLRANTRAAVIHAPEGYSDELQPLPAGVEVVTDLDGQFDWVQVFVKNTAELESVVPAAVATLKPHSLLWISFPKGRSKIQTDLTRDKGWDRLQQQDLKWVSLISVNDTWSAFALRPYRPGEPRTNWFERPGRPDSD